MSDRFDVIIAGSGAGGGMAAYTLAQAGIKVLMLEAGRDYKPLEETPMFNSNEEAPLRGASTPDKDFGYYDSAIGGWSVDGEPYTSDEGVDFKWFRARMLGGRTNHWARHSPRFGPYDFKGKSRDGLGVDWPLSYDDIETWYTKTEKIVGVCGTNEGLENHPNSPPGVLQPPPKPRAYELMLKAACDDLDIPCIPAHYAILTRDLDDRKACFYATPCIRGCSIGAAFQTTTSLIPSALATGNLTLKTDATVYEVVCDDDGKATGVRYVDGKNNERVSVNAPYVVLAASACETARILLMSKSKKHPNGLGNNSNHVGKNLMDTVGTNISGQYPVLEDRPRYNEEGMNSPHMYIPWWGYDKQKKGELDFPRGYHIEMSGGWVEAPDTGLGWLPELNGGGYGKKIKTDIRRYHGSTVWMGGRGEMLPNKDCYCELDTNVKDKNDLPVLKFFWKWSDHELKQVAHMQKMGRAIIERLGGKPLSEEKSPEEMITAPGSIIHEVGTTRMGFTPQASVVNKDGRCWDAQNVMVADGGVFASNPHKNPTLTIMALAMRNSQILAQEIKGINK